MNKVMLIGRLSKAPELRETMNRNKMCVFTLAVNGTGKNIDGSKEVFFFDIIAWHKLAENITMYANKGDRIAITGLLTQRTFKRKDGSNGSAVEIIVDSIDFLETRTDKEVQPKENVDDIFDVE